MTDSKERNPRISEGVLLALASAGAYLFDFYYEKGFASTFNIPTPFISVTLTSILTFGAVVFAVILLIMPTINLLMMLTISNQHPILKRTLFPIILFVALLLTQIVFFGIENWRQWIFFLVLLAVVIFLQLVFPLITQRGGKYIDKLEAQDRVEAQFTDSYVIIRNRFGNDFLLILLILILGSLIAQTAGTAEAVNQKEFLVTNTTPEMVVLRIYGDNMICVPFNRSTGEIKQSFTILKTTGEPGLVLKLESIGQLHSPASNPTLRPTPTAFPANTSIPAPTKRVP